MIRNIQLNHGGKYICVVDTDVESLSVSAILVVKGKKTNSQGYTLQVDAGALMPGTQIV